MIAALGDELEAAGAEFVEVVPAKARARSIWASETEPNAPTCKKLRREIPSQCGWRQPQMVNMSGFLQVSCSGGRADWREALCVSLQYYPSCRALAIELRRIVTSIPSTQFLFAG